MELFSELPLELLPVLSPETLPYERHLVAVSEEAVGTSFLGSNPGFLA
jgi:hypothetical protein